jgi:carbonic anhydrase
MVKNVELEVERIRTTGPYISKALFVGETGILGAIYDIASGEVDFLKQE